MTAEALTNLLRRHGKEIMEEAEADDERRAEENRSAKGSATGPRPDKNNNRE